MHDHLDTSPLEQLVIDSEPGRKVSWWQIARALWAEWKWWRTQRRHGAADWQ